jgi:hypothetical protein
MHQCAEILKDPAQDGSPRRCALLTYGQRVHCYYHAKVHHAPHRRPHLRVGNGTYADPYI